MDAKDNRRCEGCICPGFEDRLVVLSGSSLIYVGWFLASVTSMGILGSKALFKMKKGIGVCPSPSVLTLCIRLSDSMEEFPAGTF